MYNFEELWSLKINTEINGVWRPFEWLQFLASFKADYGGKGFYCMAVRNKEFLQTTEKYGTE
jgi:hypothetical protein